MSVKKMYFCETNYTIMDNQKFLHTAAHISNIITSVSLPMKAAGKESQLASVKSALDAVVNNPVAVLVCGEFKRGKSTFINALIGRRLCPTDTDICTSVASVISYGPKAKAKRWFGDFGDMRSEVIDIDDLEDYAVGSAEEIDNTIFIEIEMPLEALKNGLTIIDTPGVGGLDPRHAAVTNFLIPRADVAVFMTDVNEPMSSTEMAFYRDHILRSARKSLVVVNKSDLKPADETAEILADTVAKLKTYSGQAEAEIEAVAVSSVAEAYPDQGFGESNFEAMRKIIAEKADDYRQSHLDVVAADLDELINLVLAPLQAQLNQIDSPDIDQVGELTKRKNELDKEIANLTDPNSEFRNKISSIISVKREELLTYLNNATVEMQNSNLRKLMDDPRASADDGGVWMGRMLNDMLTYLSSDIAVRLNEMFAKIAAMPEFGGNLKFSAKQFEVDIASCNIEEKLPWHKRVLAGMSGMGICTIAFGLLGQFVPVVGQIAVAAVGGGVMARNIHDAVRNHNEQGLRQIYQPQITATLSNLRTYVDMRFQDFQHEWLKVVTDLAQEYRSSIQESLAQIQQIKQQMAQAVNMRVNIQNKMKPLEKAREALAAL